MSDIPLDLYKQIHAAMPIPCVDAVIFHNGSVLLCKRTNKPAQGHFWFPGGRVAKHETLEDAVRRKVRQETGMEVQHLAQLGTEETIFPDGPFGGPTHTINVVFLVVPVAPDAATIADDQHADLQWFADLPADADPYIKKYAAFGLDAARSAL